MWSKKRHSANQNVLYIILMAQMMLNKMWHPQECNKPISQMRVPIAARREPAGIQNRSPNVLYVFEHKK